MRVNGEGVHGTGELTRKRCINHAMTFDAALPFEGRRYDMNAEMRFAAWPVPGVALVQM